MNTQKKNQAEPQTVQQQVEATKALSLLDSIEKITVLAKDSGLSDEFFETIKPYSAVVAKTMQLTEMQAALFAVSVGITNFDRAGKGEYFDVDSMKSYSECPPIRLLRYLKDYAELFERKLLTRDERGDVTIHCDVFESILNNKAYVPNIDIDNVPPDIDQLFADMESLFDWRHSDERRLPQLLSKLCDLLTRNVHLPFAAKMLKLREDVDDASFVLALFFCYRLVCEDDDTIGLSQIDSLFDKAIYLRLRRSLLSQTNPLLKMKFIDNITNSGYQRGSDDFRLTDKTREEYLPEFCY